LVVEDASTHPIFENNPLVTAEPYIRFYAGAVIRDYDDLPLGTLCIIDRTPRKFCEQERQSLIAMAKLVRLEIVQPEELSIQRIRSKLQTNRDPITNAFWGNALFEEINLKLLSRAVDSQYYMLYLEFSNIEYIDNYYGSIVADEIILEVSARLRHSVSKIGPNILGRMDNKHLCVLISLNRGHNQDVIPMSSVTSELRECLTGPVKTSVSGIEPCINLAIIQDNFTVSAPNIIYRMARTFVKVLPQKAGINVTVVTDDVRQKTAIKAELTRELGQSIEQHQLHIVYQPKIDTMTEGLAGLEALVRWDHHKHGFVSPLTIIKIADESNLIYKLETWIFKTVINQVKYLKDHGLEVPLISINVTGYTLQHKDFVNFVSKQLKQSNLSKAI
jgi:predicted signal transduction protein with EAL and GGDEF domain